jgi:hypothetical protein
MQSILVAFLAIGLTSSLTAQNKPNQGGLQGDSAIVYSGQLRVVRAGSDLEGVVGNRTGGGGGFSAMFGDTPLRLRIRMDGDAFSGMDGQGLVSSVGLGIEGVFFFPSFDWVTPYVSLGAAFQQWNIMQAKENSTSSITTNHIAGRAELGTRFGRSITLSLGVLAGSTVNGHTATCPYLALGISF